MITILWTSVVVLTLLVIILIIRSVKGPLNADRLLAVNMIGTIIDAIIAGLATIFDANYLADIVILYALLSFTATLIVSRIARGVKRERSSK